MPVIQGDDELNLKCAEFVGDTLADIFRDMSNWSEEYVSTAKVNVWAIDPPHYNSRLCRWYAYITFVFWHDMRK